MVWNCADMIVGGRFRVKTPLGSGSFGELFKGQDLKTDEEVAIKMEASDSKHPQLRYEAKLYRSFDGSYGVPSVRWFGKEGGYNVLVMDLLGPSLQELLDSCGGKFSLKTVLLLADQMLSRLEWLHSRNFLHRDIKPENFVMGRGSKAQVVHMIDFGLAKKYKDKSLDHIPYRDGKRMIGTLRYASLQAHLGIEQGRRDDLESLGYVLMYFLRGSLPWQNVIRGETQQSRSASVEACKMSTSIDSLCEGFPREFVDYINTCKNMRFQEKPDYTYLKTVLRNAFTREGYSRDFIFDWAAMDLDSIPQIDKRSVNNTIASDGSKRSSQSSRNEETSTQSPSSFATDCFSSHVHSSALA